MHNYITNLCIVLYCNWGVDHPLGLSVFCLPSINNNNKKKKKKEEEEEEDGEIGVFSKT